MLWRAQFVGLWDHPPLLTVLAALPGWGRTTWLQQYEEHLRTTAPDTVVRRPRWRGELEAMVTAPPSDSPTVVLIDDILVAAEDPLWAELLQYALDHPTIRFVASSVDRPILPPAAARATVVLDEHDLRFNDEELGHFRRLLAEAGVRSDTDPIPDALMGCPDLVHRHVLHFLDRDPYAVHTHPPVVPEAMLLRLFQREYNAGRVTGSVLGEALYRGRKLRRLTLGLVCDSLAEENVLAVQFDRLRVVPTFQATHDEEFAIEAYAWTPTAWRLLREEETDEEREQSLVWALQRVRDSGRVTGQLFYLLSLGWLADAEALVIRDFRRFVLHMSPRSAELLRTMPLGPHALPGLTLLTVVLRVQQFGASTQARHDARRAIKALRTTWGLSPEQELARSCLIAFAALLAGDRAMVRRQLEHIRLFLDELGDEPQRIEQRFRVVENLHLAHRAAAHTDDHATALQILTFTARLSLPSDPQYDFDALILRTEQDLAGVRSLPDADHRTLRGEPSPAVALWHVEDGDDDAAMAAVQALAWQRVAESVGRSALDAMTLLVRALCGPESLSTGDVADVVEGSRKHWDDGRPSTTISWAAVVAYAALGARDEAKALVAELEQQEQDTFTCLARAQWHLLEGHYNEAIRACVETDGETRSTLPRTEVLVDVLRACARAGLGQMQLARARLLSMWRRHPSPALVRFAMRFLTDEAAETLVALGDDLPPLLGEALQAARHDRRPIRAQQRPRLTPSEEEVLRLMRLGHKNTEIAEARYVSMDTLRSQIKSLYRKLDATDRNDALEAAARWGLLEG